MHRARGMFKGSALWQRFADVAKAELSRLVCQARAVTGEVSTCGVLRGQPWGNVSEDHEAPWREGALVSKQGKEGRGRRVGEGMMGLLLGWGQDLPCVRQAHPLLEDKGWQGESRRHF